MVSSNDVIDTDYHHRIPHSNVDETVALLGSGSSTSSSASSRGSRRFGLVGFMIALVVLSSSTFLFFMNKQQGTPISSSSSMEVPSETSLIRSVSGLDDSGDAKQTKSKKSPIDDDDSRFVPDMWDGDEIGISSNVCLDDEMKDWHLKFTKVLDAWDYSQREGKPSQGEGIVIAQVDSGYSTHSCFDSIFTDNNKKGLNYFDREGWGRSEDFNDPKDMSWGPGAGHGTVVASAAMNRGVNGGPPGTAPKATLFSIRVINNPAMIMIDIRRMIRAFDDITTKNNNIHVVSMSLGMASYVTLKPDLENSIKRAIKAKNLIVVAAAGQLGTSGDAGGGAMNPARMNDVMAVGGVFMDNRYFGNRGPRVHIVAPAHNVCNAQSNSFGTNPNAYGPGQGTSIATAMTGGIAALWLAHHGRDYLIREFSAIGRTLNEAFMKVVEKTAQKPDGWPQRQGYGIIDALAILEMDVSTIKMYLQEDSS
mmetsp:Transcript_6906/g.7997  ORF Transcript_6906/g.7997 Transcript_6906/m.7997 type:complete len:478 (-) Transcript_6906:85-1518(-)